MDIERLGKNNKITIDAFDDNGQFLNHADTKLTLIAPDLKSTEVAIQQTAPGRYEADVTTPSPGAWHFQVTQKVSGKTIFQQTRGLVVGYSDELRIREPNVELLKSIANDSGGKYEPSPGEVFKPAAGQLATTTIPLWPHLLSAALLLFVFDVAVRRLDLSRFVS